jgi:cold shock CspA family protein
MEVPLEIAFKDVEKTPEVEADIRDRVDKLEQVYDQIISCHISVERPHKHQRSGSPYRVRIDVRVPPRHEIVVKQESGYGDMHDPLNIVLEKAFDSVERELEDVKERQRHEVKKHPDQEIQALVDKLFRQEGYGFLRELDTGREIYFHKNSVLHNHWKDLEIGTGVRFVEEMGNKGPQASTVEVVDNWPKTTP